MNEGLNSPSGRTNEKACYSSYRIRASNNHLSGNRRAYHRVYDLGELCDSASVPIYHARNIGLSLGENSARRQLHYLSSDAPLWNHYWHSMDEGPCEINFNIAACASLCRCRFGD